MSSFTNLRSERKNKEAKSFVSGSSSAITPNPVSGVPHDTTNQVVKSNKSEETSSESLYAKLSSTLDVRESPMTGRGIWTNVHVKAGKQPARGIIVIHSLTSYIGTTLVLLKPHVHVLSTRNLELYCSACTSPAPQTGLKRCTKCRVIWYCSSVGEATYLPLLCVLIAIDRPVRTTTGLCTSQSVPPSNVGPLTLLRLMLPFLRSPSDVSVVYFGGSRSFARASG